ncbi:helix-turn-helix domain-containing protein [Amycolatopsis arida]|uniref:helix-turn-helix domain-containing protein n=1 Tax=Amycolatopsis arida TaxID=587909 RepID=UPI001AB057F6|nr:helix-turn-helix transcriptional regulator [Amycolatopsis arida]
MQSREQGAVLRERRELAGLTGAQLAERTGYSPSKICRIEKGQAGQNPITVTTHLSHCGATAREVDEVLRLGEPNDPGFLARRMQNLLRALILHERTAQRILTCAPTFVPGLLQTYDYARAVMEVSGELPPKEVEQRVTARMQRQRVLSDNRALQVTFLIYEGVLRTPLGGAKVMQDQIFRLLFSCDRRNVKIRILPYSAGPLVATVGYFYLMDFEEHGPVVSIESGLGGLMIEERETIEGYRRFGSALEKQALDEGESREMLARVASEYDPPEESDDPGPGLAEE